MSKELPELLAPAGCLERLKIAISYGADAVYLGGQKFGLRSAAENFTFKEIEQGVTFAHKSSRKVYVVLNSFLHDNELAELPEFLRAIENIGVDAVICSDPGVVKTVKEFTKLEIHLSTQASCNNAFSARFWKDLGVARVILGRECSILEAAKIKEQAQIDVEIFVHGSMCIAYSGNCIISNFTAGRDSNRGGCAQSCRFEYAIKSHSEAFSKNSFFLSSKDLLGIDHIESIIKNKISSVKIEGRMKSALYLGTVVKTYRAALDSCASDCEANQEMLLCLKKELYKVTHREYCDGNLVKVAGPDSVSADRESEEMNYGMVGVVIDTTSKDTFLIEVRGVFKRGDLLEVIPFVGEPILIGSDQAVGPFGEEIVKFSPGSLVKLPKVAGIEKLNIVRIKL